MASAESFEVTTIYEDDHESLAHIILHGLNRKVKNRRSDTTYVVVDGEGHFTIQHPRESFGYIEEDIRVSAGDTVFVPRGAIYQDSGDLEMLATCVPPFSHSDVEVMK